MRKPAVDYRDFRLRRINEPMFSHLKLLFGWVVYLALFVLTENAIPPERCAVMHTWLDDRIPFWEWFVIPYVFWYVLIAFSLGYFLLYDVPNFRQLQLYLFTTQMLAVAVYILFPSRQDLRPTVFPRINMLTRLVAFLYKADTNTGVCPSLHAAFSLGLASVWLRRKQTRPFWKAFILTWTVLILLSTMFIKQHSAVDVLCAVPVCLAAEWVIYRERRRRK